MERPVRIPQEFPADHDGIRHACRNDLLGLRGFGDQADGACRDASFSTNGGGEGGKTGSLCSWEIL